MHTKIPFCSVSFPADILDVYAAFAWTVPFRNKFMLQSRSIRHTDAGTIICGAAFSQYKVCTAPTITTARTKLAKICMGRGPRKINKAPRSSTTPITLM